MTELPKEDLNLIAQIDARLKHYNLIQPIDTTEGEQEQGKAPNLTNMKTAIQELLDEIKECRNIETDLLLPFIRNKIQSKLPKEREQILTAYSFGSLNKTENLLNGVDKITAQEYYETNFNK
jgi:hypothetical protein